jgi:hypothetical protein
MMKSWFIALAALPLVAWLFVRVPQKIMPVMLAGGTEQMIAQWRDALLAYKQDHGKFPVQKEELNFGESLISCLTEENPLGQPYLDLDSVVIRQTLPMDGWNNPLRFDPDNTGDDAHIISAGPDGIFNTADDISSRDVKQRHLPVPVDPASEGRSKPKTKSAPSTKPAPNATPSPAAQPAAEPAPAP